MDLTKGNIVVDKTFLFAVRVVRLYQFLSSDKKEFVLSKQLLRCGTSVGANVREAHNGESKADFIHKMGIAQKEADESIYWLELLYATDYLKEKEFLSINKDAIEVIKLIKKIIVSSKKNLKNSKD